MYVRQQYIICSQIILFVLLTLGMLAHVVNFITVVLVHYIVYFGLRLYTEYKHLTSFFY